MRSRNIKPALFANEVLGSADPLLTLLFQGLWCLADRDGRLEDRPLRIKAQVFPYREADVNRDLTVLERLGFILRYEASANGNQGEKIKVIEVLNFRKHQHPHHTEKKSELPAPVSSPLNNGYTPSDLLIPDSLYKTSSSEQEICSDAVPSSPRKKQAINPTQDQSGADSQDATGMPHPSPKFNSTEIARMLCQQNGWSGTGMIWALQAALEFQSKRMPDCELQEVGEWLLKAYSGHKSAKGTFAFGPQKFFEQGLYCTGANRREAKTSVLKDNPATRMLAQMESA